MSKPFTAQQIFNRVVKHLRKQGHKALGPDGLCVYLASNGDKCAAGCLISKKEYSRSMEHKVFSYALSLFGPSSLKQKVKGQLNLIASLQNVHDTHHPDDWEKELQKVALMYKVKYTAPKASPSGE